MRSHFTRSSDDVSQTRMKSKSFQLEKSNSNDFFGKIFYSCRFCRQSKCGFPRIQFYSVGQIVRENFIAIHKPQGRPVLVLFS